MVLIALSACWEGGVVDDLFVVRCPRATASTPHLFATSPPSPCANITVFMVGSTKSWGGSWSRVDPLEVVVLAYTTFVRRRVRLGRPSGIPRRLWRARVQGYRYSCA